MNWLIVKNDFKRNKVINLALLLFIVFSAGLAALSVLTAVQTFLSISGLYQTAQPPHFVQMHKGEFGQEKIDRFLSYYEGAAYWQTCTMIDIYGECLTVKGGENSSGLSDCRLDIGLVRQNKTRDLLLNPDHERVSLKEGEMGIPMLLKEMYRIEIGDRVTLACNGIEKDFIVKEFILDSMMNSTMTSSTRILISDKDFSILEGQAGEYEYLIEVYFTDSKMASDFQTAYENAGLPQNGQAVTYSMIFLLSALTDIVTVFVQLMAGILLILVSFVCVRFTIMAALEEDLREIGTMKAIGITFGDIKSLYLQKYRILAITGTASGYILALMGSSVFLNHINTTFGNMGLSLPAILLSLSAGCLVYLVITFYSGTILKRIKKVTVVDALVRGEGFDKRKGSARDGLHRSKVLPADWLLGLREVFWQFRKWAVIFLVVLIAVLMILVPVNLMNTFEAPEFISYMGSSLEDILIEVENGENLDTGYTKVKNVLDRDEAIDRYYEYRRVGVQTLNADGKPLNLHIDCGDNAGNELRYLTGRTPERDKEIALSWLNAAEIGKEAGETIRLSFDGNEGEFVISGIYQDVTSGGYTAKSKHDFPGLMAEKYTFSVNLIDPADAEKKSDEWSALFGPGVTADPMREFIDQTLGGVVKQLKIIVSAIIIIGVCLAMLITALYLKLRLAKDSSEIAVLKAIGFSERDIKKQYLIKTGWISIIGILAGIVLTEILDDRIVNAALGISGLGIKKVALIPDPLIGYVLCPFILTALILAVTGFALRVVERYNIMSMINE
jgi:putative ABC transport system permease protein